VEEGSIGHSFTSALVMGCYSHWTGISPDMTAHLFFKLDESMKYHNLKYCCTGDALLELQ
jgi:hypothetical protein